MPEPSPHDAPTAPTIIEVGAVEALPPWLDLDALALFFSETMVPYHDTVEDARRGLAYAFEEGAGQGGFAVLAIDGSQLSGAVLFLHTGMKGYVPEHLLLFIAVDPAMRGRGIGGALMERGLARCEGAVKLHVEPDNPARRLYERMGFSSKYIEMRYVTP